MVATHHPGISAVQLQRQLGLRHHETAWMLLHKLRRAMVNPEREPQRLRLGRARRATQADAATRWRLGAARRDFPNGTACFVEQRAGLEAGAQPLA